MTQVAPVAVSLPVAAVSKIEFDEHEEILAGLDKVKIHDLGEVCIRVGLNAAGALVILLNGMGEWNAVVSQLTT